MLGHSILGRHLSLDVLHEAFEIFRRTARPGRYFTPFDGAALEGCAASMRASAPGTDVAVPGPSAVQVALERLRRKSLIWNAGRGLWFVEDS